MYVGGHFFADLTRGCGSGSKMAVISVSERTTIGFAVPGVLELHYLYPENRGIAFGMFQGSVLFFAIVSVLFLGVILYAWIRIPKERFYLPLLTIATVLAAGALGNFIDRFFRGYVIDFIYFSLIDFPVFNLADVYVVVSGIFLILFVCTKYRDDDFAFLNIKQ